ncbi:MAG TPA: hypothetical protein VN645_01270 [Steroidobacteraceae bacterium]|nr:hypothetical protein [Steroidobacteraceae bacterium]
MVTRESKGIMWWTGAYPLLLALMLGAIWVDRIYGPVPGEAPQQVADLLLLLAALTVLAGLIAVWLWRGRARALCVASLAVFCLEFLLPALVRALPGGAVYLQQLGPFLRFGILGAALLLAALATRKVLA